MNSGEDTRIVAVGTIGRSFLEHVDRFGVTTDDALAAFFPRQQEAVLRLRPRLLTAGFVKSARYLPNRRYFYLTRRGCQVLGIPFRRLGSLSEHSLPNYLAILYFAARSGVRKLTTREFRELFPDLWSPQTNSSAYFIDPRDVQLRLGCLLVDRDNDLRRLLDKYRRLVARRYRTPNFLGLIRAGRFCVTILTPSAGKRQDILAALAARRRGPVTARVEVVPELIDILPR